MTTFVVITKMSDATKKIEKFPSVKEAHYYALRWCDEHDLDFDLNATEAGGIGFDYRLEIINGE